MQRMNVGEGAPPPRPGGNCLGGNRDRVRYYGYGNSGYVDRHHRRYRGLHPEGRMNLAGERTPPPPRTFTLPRSDRRRLTPMTTASSVSDGGLEEGPNGRNSPPGSLDIASGQSLDPSPPSAQHPGAGRKSGIPQWEIRPLNVTAGVFFAPGARLDPDPGGVQRCVAGARRRPQNEKGTRPLCARIAPGGLFPPEVVP
jgi:hypothetical protein